MTKTLEDYEVALECAQGREEIAEGFAREALKRVLLLQQEQVEAFNDYAYARDQLQVAIKNSETAWYAYKEKALSET